MRRIGWTICRPTQYMFEHPPPTTSHFSWQWFAIAAFIQVLVGNDVRVFVIQNWSQMTSVSNILFFQHWFRAAQQDELYIKTDTTRASYNSSLLLRGILWFQAFLYLLNAAYPRHILLEMSSLLQSMEPSVILFLQSSFPAVGLPWSSLAPFSAKYTWVKSVLSFVNEEIPIYKDF